MPINVREAVTLHAVAQDECGAPRVRLDDLHTHGLTERVRRLLDEWADEGWE